MVDVKKLITGFLILATISGSLAFVLSGSLFSSAITPQEAANVQNPSNNPTKNAFVENLPSTASDTNEIVGPIPDAELPPITSSTNLTQAFASNYVRQVFKLNPGGPSVDESGYGTITNEPSANDILPGLLDSEAVKSLVIPDWDAGLNIDPQNVISQSDPVTLTAYNAAVNDILNTYFVQTNAMGILNSQSPTPPQQPASHQIYIKEARTKQKKK